MRRIMRLMAWAVVLLFAILIGKTGYQYFFPSAPRVGALPQMQLTPGPTVVVVPHSDDEVLAAGGVIRQLVEAGVQPTVVLVTGSDAFTMAARTLYGKPSVTGADMVKFGRLRLGESRAALEKLGLSPDHLVFLGYPDQGTDRLWNECWVIQAPCKSSTTGAMAVPYSEARSPNAPFAGESLLQELVTVMRQAHPARVIYPHPNEAHVDHWGVSNFTTAALEVLRREPGWEPPEEWLYLVHRGDWPAPKGLKPNADLLPPESLVGGMTTWYTESLTADQVKRKEDAVGAYATQTALLRRYMESFVRSNELYGRLARAYLNVSPATNPGTPPMGGPPWGAAWSEVITDPAGDTRARVLERSADVTGVWAARDGDSMQVAVKLAAPLRGSVEVRLYAKGMSKDRAWNQSYGMAVQPDGKVRTLAWPSGAVGPAADVRGQWIRFSVPLSVIKADEAVMIDAQTQWRGLLVDRTAWRLIGLDGR